ncbi:MAG TPA: hypothetical protein VJN94_12155 [Candidatus Binataceae bacterium]|nr:hypothetical protein [Candidatus Binataceae bacterium]
MKRALQLVLAAAAMLPILLVPPAHAQDSGSAVKTITLYVDRKSKQLFLEPAPDRVPIKVLGEFDPDALADQVQRKVSEQTRQQVHDEVAQSQAQTLAQQKALQQQVASMEPAWSTYLKNFQNKFRLGALAYVDWGMWTHTGYGPFFLENLNTPGVGNNSYNSFDLNRVYLNAYFTPTPTLTMRVTPELYRALGTATASKFGTTTEVGSNLDGNLNLRIKFAYVQYEGLLDRIADLKGGTITFGAQQNPLISWQDDFSQYRFVYLSPWNYVGMSSSQIGLGLAGPLKMSGNEATYVDYAFGAFDNGNFNNAEQSNTTQAMGRVTVYPFGAHWRYDGLGITGFYDYGYGNVAPDSGSLPTPLKGNNAHFERISALLHYAAEQWNVLGEFDYGNNAFTLANLYRGAGPSDAFGTPTGAPVTKVPAGSTTFLGNKCSSTAPCYPLFDTYGPQVATYQAFLNNGRSRQLGVDFLGRYHIPGTKLTAFGMFQWFMPNDNVPEDPLDFQRFVLGLSYSFNEYVRIAVDSQNLLFYHDQFGIPVSTAERFNYVPGSKFNGQLLPGNSKVPASLGTIIPDEVPRDTHAFFVNLEFAY